jgi:LPXTG-site transpeptidase (sortase) family protein
MLRRLLFVLPIYVSLILIGVLYSYTNKMRLDQNVANTVLAAASAGPVQNTDAYEGIPTSLYVPSIDLRLPVIDGSYSPATQSWVLSADKAHFAAETTKLNTKGGMSLIYGHYNSKVFKATDDLKIGDLIEVKTDTNNVFTYKFVDSKVVTPTDTSLFDYSGKPRLSLLTCTGTWFENRRIMNFELIAARKAD